MVGVNSIRSDIKFNDIEGHSQLPVRRKEKFMFS